MRTTHSLALALTALSAAALLPPALASNTPFPLREPQRQLPPPRRSAWR
jgi:hypothetical protein